jgi:hypothetical protein
LAIRDRERSFDLTSIITEEDILHWCSSLVRRSTKVIGFGLAHFTVKEFLEAIDPLEKPSFQQYYLSSDHTILAKACLNFIRCQKFGGSQRPSIDPGINYKDDVDDEEDDEWWEPWNALTTEYPFLGYSILHWSHHVHNSYWDIVENDVWDLFSTDTTNTLAFWTGGWLFYERAGNEYFEPSRYFGSPQSPTALH